MLDETKALIFSIVFFFVGGFVFFKGFVWMRQKKLIENIPTSKIRSLAMGLVEIKGKVLKGEKVLSSPFSSKPCVWYKYKIEEYRKQGKNSRWVTIKHGREGVHFKLQDNTDDVLVDPEGAQIDIPQDGQFKSGVGNGAPAMIQQFCDAQGIRTKGWFFNRQMKYTEYFIEPGDDLYIIGTAGDNPFVDDTTGKKNVDDIMIQKGKNEKFYYISDKGEKGVLKTLKWKVFGGLAGGAVLMLGCLAYMLFYLGLF
ncbi:GIDE domain-containing protein [Nanoarchaeota archaeon]